MTSLELRLKDDIKVAMKAGQKDDLEVLRMVLSDVKNAAILEGLAREGFDDELVLRVIRKGLKTRSESASVYAEAGRSDLEQKERDQIVVLERYVPKALSDEDLAALVRTVVTELGALTKKEMGAVVKEVMARAGGRADGKAVSGQVGRLLT